MSEDQSRPFESAAPNMQASTAAGSRWPVYLLLALLGLLIRFPFFFPAVINWDESTFVLVGQSMLDGGRLYVDVWDVKPPLAFAFFAFVIELLGRSIIAVRLAGAMCVVAVSWITFEIGAVLSGRRVGLWAGVLCVGLLSLAPGSEATMTEHVALVPLMAGLLVLVVRPWRTTVLMLAGALMATACMVRLNLALVPLAVGAVLLFLPRPFRPSVMSKRLLAYSLGGVAAVSVPALLLLAQSGWRLLWSSVVLAPLAYATSQLSVQEAILRQLSLAFRMVTFREDYLWGIGILGWVICPVGWGRLISREVRASREARDCIVLVGVTFAAIAISIVGGGAAHSHYLIQLAPFLSLGGGCLIHLVTRKRPVVALVVFGACFGVALTPVAREYRTAASRLAEGLPLRYGPAFEIANYLRAEGRDQGRMLFLVDHLALWCLDSKPLLPSVTHPSNIAKPHLLALIYGKTRTTKDEMSRLLDMEPDVVVTQKSLGYLVGDSDLQEARAMLDSRLAARYRLANVIDDRLIYIRKENREE